MAKKAKVKRSPLTCLIVAVACALVLLVLFCPVVTMHVSGGIGGLQGETEKTPLTLVDMLQGMGVNSDNVTDASGNALTAYTAFFAGDKSEAKVYTVFLLIAVIVACVGVVAGVLGIFFKNIGKYVKFVGAATLLFALVAFIMGFVTGGAYSGSLDIVGFITGNYTVSIGWATIVAFVGSVVAGVTPFVLKSE